MEHDEETFAGALRRLRGELSLRELARRACCSKSMISDLEHERRSPTPRIAAALDRALGAGGRLVALVATPQGPAADDGLAELLEVDDVWRRTFLKGAGGAVAAAGIGVGGDADGRELLSAHRALRAAHGRLDNLRGAAAVYTEAMAHHQQVTDWLVSTRTASERWLVMALAADTGGFVGFLSADLGMTNAAVTAYREAALHAQRAGDISCCTNLVGQVSRILADQGDFSRARDLADRAVNMAGTRAHPAVRSWLHAVRAHHHAGRDDATAARSDLRAAWKLLEKTDDGEVPPYIGYLSAAEVNKWTGHTMWRLGRRAPAYLASGKSALDEARTDWPATSVRGSAEVFTASARVSAASGDRDSATDLLTRSIDIATKTRSARNLRAALAAQADLNGTTAA